MTPPMGDVTELLREAGAGDPRAADRLLGVVYAELRKLAAGRLARERPGQTLDATELVHEAFLRLVPPGNSPRVQGDFANRGHFFAAAATAMRRIIVDRARARSAAK